MFLKTKLYMGSLAISVTPAIEGMLSPNLIRFHFYFNFNESFILKILMPEDSDFNICN